MWLGTDEWTTDTGLAVIDILIGIEDKVYAVKNKKSRVQRTKQQG